MRFHYEQSLFVNPVMMVKTMKKDVFFAFENAEYQNIAFVNMDPFVIRKIMLQIFIMFNFTLIVLDYLLDFFMDYLGAFIIFFTELFEHFPKVVGNIKAKWH